MGDALLCSAGPIDDVLCMDPRLPPDLPHKQRYFVHLSENQQQYHHSQGNRIRHWRSHDPRQDQSKESHIDTKTRI